VNTGESEAPRKGLYFGGNRPTPPDAIHHWEVFCFDLETGHTLWRRRAHEGKPASAKHLKNSFASETPVTDGERVYCCFGNVGVFCFDLDGKLLWSTRIEPHRTRFGWGTAASPVLHEDRLYLLNDNEEDSHLLALDKRTGREASRTARDEKSNWSSPYVWRNEQRTEIVTAGTGKVRSYDLDGKLLWSLEGMSSITIATPYACQGLLYISSGYVLSPLQPIYAIRPGAEGDITLTGDQTSNRWIAWAQRKAAPYNPTTLVHNGRLYVLYDRGFLACYDARNGSAVYQRQRIPDGRAFTSSPWACGDKILCLSEDGVTFVFQAGDQFQMLRANPLAEDDMCLATPALAGDRLLIRSSARLYCLRASGRKRTRPKA
jgi:outer membrane protein assembly factor BamB